MFILNWQIIEKKFPLRNGKFRQEGGKNPT